MRGPGFSVRYEDESAAVVIAHHFTVTASGWPSMREKVRRYFSLCKLFRKLLKGCLLAAMGQRAELILQNTAVKNGTLINYGIGKPFRATSAQKVARGKSASLQILLGHAALSNSPEGLSRYSKVSAGFLNRIAPV